MKNNTRRIAAAVLAFCITAGTMPARNYRTVFPTAYAAEEEGTYVAKDGMVYKEYSDHISIFYCEPDGDTIYIPDTIDGKPVTELEPWAFVKDSIAGWDIEVPTLPVDTKKVYIPEGVEVIGEGAFECDLDKEGIHEVHFPSTLKKVDRYAFFCNKNLNVFGLPETAEIMDDAFVGTRYIYDKRANFIEKDGMYYWEYPDHIYLAYCEPDGDTLYIPDTIDGKPVTSVGYAYDPEEKIFKTPELPDSVKKVYIPEGVEKVSGFICPEGNEGLYEVYLPSTLKNVWLHSFKNNEYLNVFGLPETAEVGREAFECTRYIYDKRANFIEKDGMYYWEYPDHIYLAYCEPDGDTLYIPDTIDGKPVTSVGYAYDPEEKIFKTPELPDSVKKVYIPEGVEKVSGFICPEGNEGLYEVYLPSTLKNVWLHSFKNNEYLNVFGLPETAEVGREAFEGTRYFYDERANFIEKDGMYYWEYPDHISMIYCEPDGDTLYIPDTVNGKPVTTIGSNAFAVDSFEKMSYPDLPETVRKVYIPEGVELINAGAFAGDFEKSGISEVYLPSTLKKVCDGAFYCNKNLNVFGLPETAKVEYPAFEGTRYFYDERANFIEKDGMYYWEYPDHIYLTYCEPDGDTLYIPDTVNGKPVTAVGIYDYEEYYETFNEYYRFETPWLPESVKKIYIPEGVEEVEGFGCPEGKDSIYEVHFPSTIKKVYGGAFVNQKNLNVYGLPETAKVEWPSFDGTRYIYEWQLNFKEKDGMIYEEYPDHIKLFYCEPEGDTLYIPDMIDGKPVTEVCGKDEIDLNIDYYGIEIPSLPDTVKEVMIPEGIKVSESAFAGTKFEGKFTTAPAAKIAYGDVNLDGKVTLADSLAILQFIANEDKYPLSAQAQKNADCYNPGDGITGNDAVAVMRYDTKVVSELPIIEK